MQGIYQLDHKFDLLADKRGQMYALRLYIDMIVHEVVGNHPNETALFLERLLRAKYPAFLSAFSVNTGFCNHPDFPNQIPTAQHVVS